ncbi:MAG: thioredoxin family protein [Bacilli bacterium]
MKILKFGALWCPGCLIMKPRWEEIEKENTWLKTEYYDYDKNKEVVDKWNIGSILPVFIFVDKDNDEFLRLIGEQSKKKLINLILTNKDR